VISAKKKLGSATLTVAVLVVFFVLTLAAFLLRVLAGLAALLTLSRLATLLALSDLAALLTFLLHIVCHEIFLLRRRGPSHAFGIYRHLKLSCCKTLQRLGSFPSRTGPVLHPGGQESVPKKSSLPREFTSQEQAARIVALAPAPIRCLVAKGE
jgi:hypothetical protein